MICFRAIVDGGESTVYRIINALLSDSVVTGQGMRIQIVFLFSGKLWSFDECPRVSGFSRASKQIDVDIPVPQELLTGDCRFATSTEHLKACGAFLVMAIRESVELAARTFKRRKVTFNVSKARRLANAYAMQLTTEAMTAALNPQLFNSPSAELLKRVRNASMRAKQPK